MPIRNTYDDEEAQELFEVGWIDECGNWINHSTCIGYWN